MARTTYPHSVLPLSFVDSAVLHLDRRQFFAVHHAESLLDEFVRLVNGLIILVRLLPGSHARDSLLHRLIIFRGQGPLDLICRALLIAAVLDSLLLTVLILLICSGRGGGRM